MDRKDFRSLLSKLADTTKLNATAPYRLLKRAGRAMGVDASERRGAFEPLEPRTMLEGSFTNAVAITIGGDGVGTYTATNGANVINPAQAATDNDFFTFTAPATDFVTLLADTANETPTSTLNTRISVFNSSGVSIATGTNNGQLTSGVATDGFVGFVAQAGETYFVVVSSDYPNPQPNLTTGNTYKLRVDALTTEFDVGGELTTELGVGREDGSPVPNTQTNTPITPILGQLGGTAPVGSRLRQDNIVYKFVVPNGSQYDNFVTINAQSTQQANLAARLDTRLDIYNAQGQLVASDSDAGRINDAFTTIRARPGETYYIRVRSDEIRNANQQLAAGPFFLVLDAMTTPVAMNPVTRVGSSGGGFVGFGPPTVPASPNMNDPVFETASYEFTAQGSGLTIITQRGAPLPPLTDGALHLYNDKGELIAFNNNFGGLDPQISAILEGGKRYFIVVDGFALNSGSVHTLVIESNHTSNNGVDDHINTPTTGDYNSVRNQFEQATGLVFGTAQPLIDDDGNIVQDHSLFQTATGQGRIEAAGDTDLFQFVAPVSMLQNHDGDNNDAGTSLYLGGSFQLANPNDPWPTINRDLAAWDASDYFNTGRQFVDPDAGVTWGFADNTDPTSLAPRAEIYALLDYDPGFPTTVPQGMSRRWLVVAGDFDLVLPDPATGLPVVAKNIAIWRQDFNTGRWFWEPGLGNVNGPVRALASYLPDESFESRDNPAVEADSNRPVIGGQAVPYLVIGGSFTNAGGVAANNIATFDGINGWQNLVGGTNGPVNALTTYDPEDVGEEREANPGPPALGLVQESRDIPNSLIVGGQFTNIGGRAVSNLGLFDGVATDSVWSGPFNLNRNGAGPNGPVFALSTYKGWDPDGPTADPAPAFPAPIPGEIEAPDEVLIIGGQFTTIADGRGNNIAATNLAAWGFLGSNGGSRENQRPDYNPQAGWQQVDAGITGVNEAGDPVAVLALTRWDPPDINNTTIDPVLVIGGSFSVGVINNIVAFQVVDDPGSGLPLPVGMGWFSASRGTTTVVRALTTVTDLEEPSIATDLNSGVPQEVLYLGGDFDGFFNTANPAAQPEPAAHVAQYSAHHDPNTGQDFFAFTALDGGVGNVDPNIAAPTIFALSGFDDGNPLEWDRHDRPAQRLQISVAGESGSFMNARVRVFDSNFNLIYGFDRRGSETLSPINPDPAGMISGSFAAPGFDDELEGITVWGGETYYIEVSDLTNAGGPRGTGRYQMSVTTAAPADDLNGDGTLDNVNAQITEEPDAGNFDDAFTNAINTQLGNGDGTNVRNAGTPSQNPLVPNGNMRRVQHVTPSINDVFVEGYDLGNIHDVDDTDLYSFRAEFTGTVEIRIDTTFLANQYGETLAGTHPDDFRDLAKTFSSFFDGALRVFRNDFVQIGYNDDNYAVGGQWLATGPNSAAVTSGSTAVGTIGPAVFNRRDPRIVIPVVAGNVYFVQVESGQRWRNGAAEDPADRTEFGLAESETRLDHGAYRLMINQMPNQQAEVINGQQVLDDHFDNNQDFATPIPIGDVLGSVGNGTGSITGLIRNTPLNPQDTDLFQFIAPGSGNMTIRVRPTGTANALNPDFALFAYDDNGVFGAGAIATGSPLAGGGMTATVQVVAGTKFVLSVFGQGNTQGAYIVEISGIPAVDDNADQIKFGNAQEIQLFDFQGLGTASGNIETRGDTDTFKFRVNTFSPFSINVTATDSTLTPSITVYEVSEDLSGNPILLRIGAATAATGANNTTVSFPVTPDRRIVDDNGVVLRDYPFYYIVIKGADTTAEFGRYNVSVNFAPSDDHADGDTDLDGVFDTGEFTLATLIPLDSTTGQGNDTGVIEVNTDSDLFVFTAPASGSASIVVSRPSTSTIRTRVSILDANGVTLASGIAADDANFGTAIATLDVTRGVRYFVVVEGFEDAGVPNVNTTRTGDYTLSVIAPPVDDFPNATEFDLANAASNIPLASGTGIGRMGGTAGNDPSNPRLSPSGDTDLFTFTSIRQGNITVTVNPFATGVGQIAARLTIIAADRSTVVGTADGGLLTPVSVVLTNVAPGTRFYVLVEAITTVPSSTPTGEYSITVAGPAAPGTGGGAPDSIDFTDPSVISLNPRTGDGQKSDAIEVVTDRDLFRFTTTAAGKVFVQIQAGTGSLLRASVSVYNAANELVGSRVAFDSDGVPGSVAFVAFDGAALTDYYVVVDGLGDSTGSYSVRVNTQPLVNELVYPEGYASANTREFVSIVNPNDVDVTYTIYLRYETGSLETVVATAIIPANSRSGLTIIDPSYRTPGLRLDTPYAIVINSDKPLGATLAHYDFGNSIGDSFTETTSPTWNFARIEKNPGAALDFVIFYNPNNFDVNATLTALVNGVSTSVTLTFGAHRRGGFSINDIAAFPTGVYGATLTVAPVSPANNSAFIGVVASLSHYALSEGAAFGLVGDATGGATAGVITNLAQGDTTSSEVNLFNPGNTPATVTLTGSYIRTTLPSFTKTFQVPARSSVRIGGDTLGLSPDQPIGLTYSSNVPVVVASDQLQNGDADSTNSATSAATQFFFGDAYVDPRFPGSQEESIFLYNPGNTANVITLQLNYIDGTFDIITRTVAARGFAEVQLHNLDEIRNKNAPTWFAIDARSTSFQPFVAGMTHYDLALGGGWATGGVPFGVNTPLNKIS